MTPLYSGGCIFVVPQTPESGIPVGLLTTSVYGGGYRRQPPVSRPELIRETDCHGAFDPTDVSKVNVAGESLYYVAATGRGVQPLRSTDLKHWQPAGNVFEQSAPDWTL